MSQTEKAPGAQSNPPAPPVGDLRANVAVVRRHLKVILAMTLLVVGSAAVFTLRQTPTYVSTSRVLVKPLNPNQVLQGLNANTLVNMSTEVALASSPDVATLASEKVEAQGGSAVESGSLTVEVPPNTTFLDFAYSHRDPQEAQRWAQAYAEAYIEDRSKDALSAYESARSGYEQGIEDLQLELELKLEQLDAAPRAERPAIRRSLTTLRTQISVLQTQLAQLPAPGSDVAQIVADASLPEHPSSPKVLQNLVLALIVGLGLGVAVAMIRERLDDRMLGREDLEGQLGAPTLAIVPHAKRWRRRKTPHLPAMDASRSAQAEAFRTMRTSLEFIARGHIPSTFLITSPSMDEGKTTITANLAVTLAQTGKRVIALSGDLRKASLHRFFDLPNDIGLTSYLRGQASIPEIAQRCALSSLRIIASGPIPHDPAELLTSNEMRTLLVQLKRNADYVLVDSPPVLAVSDPLIIAPLVDGVIVIANAQSTTRPAMTHARELLEQGGAKIVGGVFNNFDPRRVKYYPRYYYYYTKGEKHRNRGATSASVQGNGQRVDKPATGEVDSIWQEGASVPQPPPTTR